MPCVFANSAEVKGEVFTISHIAEALTASLFTWSITAAGAGLVFVFRKNSKNMMDAMLGFAGGVMIAASFWSLLSPALEAAAEAGLCPWATALSGFLGGGLLLYYGDKIFVRFERKIFSSRSEEDKQRIKRCLLLVFSVTLHNIPEGLAIGVAFGSLAYDLEGATRASAVLLAAGIGIQNFPEGTAVSVPLLREGLSRKKAFFFGQLSGVVEPAAALTGAVLAVRMQILLPFLLAFAAGAMIYVVVEELIPESQTNENKDKMALATLTGFSFMMVLDTALG